MVGLGMAAFIILMVGVNWLVKITTPISYIKDDFTGEIVETTGQSILEPLLYINTLAGMCMLAGGGLGVAYLAIPRFFKNTIAAHSNSESLDVSWVNDMTRLEKTRWAIAVTVALACALIVGAK